GPSSGSSARTARTGAPAPPGCDPCGPTRRGAPRSSGGYGGRVFGIVDSLLPPRGTVSTEPGQVQVWRRSWKRKPVILARLSATAKAVRTEPQPVSSALQKTSPVGAGPA